MQERYEIRGKIGQGGLGAVYRAFDRSLNREVAIKRILAGDDGPQREEAARQMAQETGALAALQHPNIVTIYDVGTDEDGPYVVMELLKGETIDAIVERAPLTYSDFREFAAQVQEGLIAAQDLGFVHRDLKPSNVMVNWLPSGKFQVKLVDFGLAKFSPKPSHQTVDHNDSVYGSIFFMAPEQFERAALDSRTDMYAIGCVYYFALAGRTPFEGDTGPQVMASHLEHRVVPLAEVRPDIPRWVADWVMWHINRLPSDRPENAREALRNFIELDSPASQVMSQEPPNPEAPRRPRLIIPGAAPAEPVAPAPAPVAVPAPAPVPTQTAPQPLMPPAGAPPSVHTTAQQAYVAPQEIPAAVPVPEAAIPVPEPVAPPVQVAPQPVVVPQAVPVAPQPAVVPQPALVPQPVVVPQAVAAPQPVVVPQAVPVAPQPVPVVPIQAAPRPAFVTPTAAPAPAAATPTAPGLRVGVPGAMPQATAPATQRPIGNTSTVGGYLPPKKAGMSNAAKGLIAGILTLLVIVLVMVFVQMSGKSNRNERYNALVKIAGDPAATEVPVNREDLEILLDGTRAGSNRGRETVYKALSIATATDGTDIDGRIVEFATKEILPDDIRTSLLSRVLLKRASPAIVTPLLEFARETDNEAAAAAAIKAVTSVASDDEFDDLIDVIQFSPSAGIRKAAEDAAAEMISKSEKKEQYSTALADAVKGAVNDDNRRTMIRLIGRSGGEKGEEIINGILEGDDKLDQLAAIEALRNWADDSMFPRLIEYLEGLEDEQLRAKAFEAGYSFLIMDGRKRDDLDSEEFWKELARNAKTEREEITIVSGLAAKGASDWALSVVEFFADESESDRVIDLAEKGAGAIRDRMKIQGDDE
ncbi:MAG: protein kinase [Akkermansiaceae bacterium]|jgi:serine/threonine-protein kinase|nr:protein kinase [Akkermansiaceae bacterium]